MELDNLEFCAEGDVLTDLENLCKREGGQRAAARKLGLSPSYIHDLLRGKRDMTEQVAAKFGYRRIVFWARQTAPPAPRREGEG